MRYLVLSWDSFDLKKYRRCGWFDPAYATDAAEAAVAEAAAIDAAWARVAELWRNPRVRLALVVAVPPKPKRALTDLLREEAEMPARFTIPRWLTGNEKPLEGSPPLAAAWSR